MDIAVKVLAVFGALFLTFFFLKFLMMGGMMLGLGMAWGDMFSLCSNHMSQMMDIRNTTT